MRKEINLTIMSQRCLAVCKALRRVIRVMSMTAGLAMPVAASEHFYSFDPPNGDPVKSGLILFGANVPNAWHTNNGASGSATDGFLEITPAQYYENLGVLFPVDYFTNADNSLVPLPLKGFLVEADVRVGDATGNNGQPGEGFSISFADRSDPVVYWGSQGNFRGWAGGDSAVQAQEPSGFSCANGTAAMDPLQCDSGTAENGTKTGISVQFDTKTGIWVQHDSGTLAWSTILDESGLPAADNVGWRVHYNGKLLKRIIAQPPSGPVKSQDGTNDLNGLAVCPAYDSGFNQDPACKALVCADRDTIETGTYNQTNNGSVHTLCWAHLTIELTTNTPHELSVRYKGRQLVDHLVLTNYLMFVGRLVIGGRTFLENENCDIDNLHVVTYPAVQALFTGVTSASCFIDDFSLNLTNIGPAKVTNITQVTLDGVDVTPSTTITIGETSSIATFHSATNFAPGSAHTAGISFSDALGTAQTNTIGFTVLLPWTIMPASLAVPASSVDTNSFVNTGTRIQAFQSSVGMSTRNYWADETLMGLHGTNLIDLTSVNGYDPATGEIADEGAGSVIFWGIDTTSTSGEFPPVASPFLRTFSWLGIPGENAATNAPNDNIALVFSSYLHFPKAGTYVMGFNSDDGARVTFAKNSHDLLGTEIPGLNFDGGRGIGRDQNVAALIITQPGFYGCRLLYYQGGGGAAVEWYFKSTPDTGGIQNLLVNDSIDNPLSISAYQISSAAPPYVSYAEPPLDDDQVNPDADFKWQLTDASTTVNSNSVALKINGVTQSPTVSSSKGVTTLSLRHTPAQPRAPGTNVVDLTFKDSAGTNYAYNYSFVVPPPPTISLGQQGVSWVITYTGTLYSSATVNGTYTPVSGARSPYTLPTRSGLSQYYRAHQ
jgi:hypothetical protein